jgi:hypothetical protein
MRGGGRKMVVVATTYLIFSEKTVAGLMEVVQKKIKEGWTPIGGPFVHPDPEDDTPLLGQAMIKPSK